MPFDSQKHHRRSIRLKGYDYSQAGAYFITICCQDKECRFGKIIVGAGFTPAQNDNDKIIAQLQNAQPHIGQPQGIAPTDTDAQMELNEYGQIAYDEWIKLPQRFSNFELDVFQIMPNHMHGIIVLNDAVGAGFTPALNDNDKIIVQPQNEQPQLGQPQGVAPTNTTVGDIVGAYKSLVANGCLDIYKTKNLTMGKLWQRNYHEHIIRNEQSYQTISNYIVNNPTKWKDDKFFKG